MSGVQANNPPKHPPVEYIPKIREHAVHPPLQNDPVIAVQADAPRLRSSTRIRTVPKWHKDYVVSDVFVEKLAQILGLLW